MNETLSPHHTDAAETWGEAVRRLQALLPPGTESPIGQVVARRHYRLQSVPVAAPTLIVVLRGEKTMVHGGQTVRARRGDWLALPADCTVDVTNRPEHGLNHALAVSFGPDDLASARGAGEAPSLWGSPSLRVEPTGAMWQALVHFAEIATEAPAELLAHRRREVLLAMLLSGQAEHLLIDAADSTTARVAHLLAAEPGGAWRAAAVARRLAVSEPTLRRRLADEGTSFRALLAEVRLGTALGLLQQGAVSVQEAAGRCGYNSASRFAQRFRERFGTSPSQVAASDD